MANPEVAYSLEEAVAEVLGTLTGLNVSYEAEEDRYHSITRQINRALRSVATDNDWAYYSSTENAGTAHVGVRNVELRATVRPRILIDDSVRLCRVSDGYPMVWAHFLPREAINKVPDREQLWVAHTRSSLEFSRPFRSAEEGLDIMVPVMREPKMFRLPPAGDAVPQTVKDQLVDFEWPDLVIAKAAYFYAQTQPMMQPRVQTLEAAYMDLMYALKNRDTKNTDAPFMNPWSVPVDGSIFGTGSVSHRPYGEGLR